MYIDLFSGCGGLALGLHKAGWKGLFAIEDLEENHVFTFYPSHVIVDKELIRTPLGGFLNHSEQANAFLIKVDHKYFIKTCRSINKEEEITVNYIEHTFCYD